MQSEMFDAHRRVEADHWWFVGRRQALDGLMKVAQEAPNTGSIVDVGCGTGGMVAMLHKRWPMIGVDASDEAIGMAKALYPECDFRVGYVPQDLEPLSADASLWLLLDVLEHIEDDKTFLGDVISKARVGSHILVTVPADPRLWSQHDVTALHQRRYERDSLAALWSDQPVSVRLFSHFNSRLYPLIYLARWLGNKFKFSYGKDGTDFGIPPAPANALLAKIFGGEGEVLLKTLDSDKPQFHQGCSLVALLRREAEG
ncbi:MAG: class I SAM-dependent methyltransferase [Rhodospirillaceae bacterium]